MGAPLVASYHYRGAVARDPGTQPVGQDVGRVTGGQLQTSSPCARTLRVRPRQGVEPSGESAVGDRGTVPPLVWPPRGSHDHTVLLRTLATPHPKAEARKRRWSSNGTGANDRSAITVVEKSRGLVPLGTA
jgi:hypothetical protein